MDSARCRHERRCEGRHELRLEGLFALLLLVLTMALLPTSAFAAELPATTATITVEKQLTGDVPSSDEAFSFALAPDDASCPMPEGAQGDTLVIEGAGTGSFGKITYEEPGNYSYTLKETAGSVASYTYDATVYWVTVYVTTDDAGNLTAKVWANKEGSDDKAAQAVFVNNYQDPTSLYAPKTGDATNIVPWMVLAGCAAVVLLVLLVVRARQKRKRMRR